MRGRIQELCVNNAKPPLPFVLRTNDGHILAHIPKREDHPVLFVLARYLQYGVQVELAAAQAIEGIPTPMSVDLPQVQNLFAAIDALHDCDECRRRWEMDQHILDDCDDGSEWELRARKFLQLRAQLMGTYCRAQDYAALFPPIELNNHAQVLSDIGVCLKKLDEPEWIFLYQSGSAPSMLAKGEGPMYAFCREYCENE